MLMLSVSDNASVSVPFFMQLGVPVSVCHSVPRLNKRLSFGGSESLSPSLYLLFGLGVCELCRREIMPNSGCCPQSGEVHRPAHCMSEWELFTFGMTSKYRG